MAATDTTMDATAVAGRGEGLSREILVLAGVVILGTIMTLLDLTLVNVAIPILARDLGRPDPGDPVGDDRLHARVRHRHPADRVGGRTVRRQASVDRRAAGVPGGVGARRGGVVSWVADCLPGAAGARCRDDPAHRADDPGPGRRPAADGPGDERDRGADAAGPGVRAAARRGDHWRDQLAVDLLHQPAGGSGGRGGGGPGAARWVWG